MPKKKSIPIISPTIVQNKILLGNPYAIKVNSSTATQLSIIANYVSTNFASENILIVSTNQVKDVPHVTNLFHLINSGLNVKKDSSIIVSIKGNSVNIEAFLKKEKKNIIILPSNNQVLVTQFISTLQSLTINYNITLIGMQTWMGFDNLDLDYLNRVSLHLPSNFYINYNLTETNLFSNNYKNIYLAEPGLMAYVGFDIGIFFFNAINKHGINFLYNVSEKEEKGICTSFNLFKTSIESGYENNFCHLLKYDNFELIDLNKQ